MNRIRVGPFDVYPSERRLLAAGRPVELGGRAFDLLLVLAEQPGRLVGKSTLLERVWPKLVVDENNLPAQVAALRRVLGAGAIHTVPGFGYRLDLPVARDEATMTASAAPQVPGAPAPPAAEPRRLNIPRRSFPGRLGPLLGRERELAELQQALAASRLVSLVGVAGAGKTRLAQELLAHEIERAGAAATWVSLRAFTDIAHVPSAIAVALGVSLPEGVDGFDALAEALDGTSLLLVLDGTEHLAAALAAPLASLLARSRGMRLLITSQAPLGAPGEQVYRLACLELPAADAPPGQIAASAAVQFFVQRTAAAGRRCEVTPATAAQIAEVCRRLDGNPLALELAAARVPALGIAALLERLDDRFRLLRLPARPDEPRQGALLAAFDWSYGLLTPAEQQVFDALGAFAGSFPLQAAARCVADEAIDVAEAVDLLGRLVDRSLLMALPVEPPRFALSETARHYARARLEATGRGHAARRRLAAAMLELLDLAYAEYWSLDEAVWLARFEPDLANVRAAIDWAAEHDRELGIALYGSAWPLFVEADLVAEGRERFEQTVVLLRDSLPAARIGRFWEAMATYESTRRWDRARYAAELAAARQAPEDARARYYALLLLALNWRGDPIAARAAWESARALENPAWPVRLLALGAMTEGALAAAAGDHATARAAYAHAVRHALSASERLALAATVCIVELDIACGDYAAALQLARPLTLSLRHSGRRETYFELLVLAFSALLLAGETAEARELGAELLAMARRPGGDRLHTVLDAMALLACMDGQPAVAVRIGECADRELAAHGQAGRRPAEQRVRDALASRLAAAGDRAAPAGAARVHMPADAAAACALALGLAV